MNIFRQCTISLFLIILVSCAEAQNLSNEDILKEENVSLVTVVSYQDLRIVVLRQDLHRKPSIVRLYIVDSKLKVIDQCDTQSNSSNLSYGISDAYFILSGSGLYSTIIFNAESRELMKSESRLPAMGKIYIHSDYAYTRGLSAGPPAVLDLKTGEIFRKDYLPFGAGNIWIEDDHVYIYSSPGWNDEDIAIEFFKDATFQEVPYDKNKAKAASDEKWAWYEEVSSITKDFQELLGIPIYRSYQP